MDLIENLKLTSFVPQGEQMEVEEALSSSLEKRESAAKEAVSSSIERREGTVKNEAGFETCRCFYFFLN